MLINTQREARWERMTILFLTETHGTTSNRSEARRVDRHPLKRIGLLLHPLSEPPSEAITCQASLGFGPPFPEVGAVLWMHNPLRVSFDPGFSWNRRVEPSTRWALSHKLRPSPPPTRAPPDISFKVGDLHQAHTGGKGTLTQWVHCEFVVSFEAIRPVITQQVCGEFF